MRIHVQLLEPFDREESKFTHDLDGSTVADLIDELFSGEDQEKKKLLVQGGDINPDMFILVNGGDAGLEKELADGDQVVISRNISGG